MNAARRLARRVKTRYVPAVPIEHPRVLVDPNAAERVVHAQKQLGSPKRALQGYLWVTGTPFSLEYPSLRGGFGWHDISWKHHFQV